MSKRRWLTVLVGLMLLSCVPGCGGCGAGARGKNSDLDRPKAGGK